jgi:hypothetical protein
MSTYIAAKIFRYLGSRTMPRGSAMNRAIQKEILANPDLPAGCLYASEWKRVLLKGELQSTLRLSLMPGLAAAAALEMKRTESDKGIW